MQPFKFRQDQIKNKDMKTCINIRKMN